MKRFGTIFALAITALFAATVSAQQTFNQALKQMKIDQKLGSQVPAEATFNDETGTPIKLSSLLGKRPIIILPMFFTCQGVCGTEVDSLLKSVAKTNVKVGEDYDVILLSINPRETSELAANKKTSLLKVFDDEGSKRGFHFLTGKLDQIRSVTDALGFGFAYDPADGRINHPAGLMILTPGGRVSQYIYGAVYPKTELENSIALAAQDKVGRKAEVILLGCIMIDPVTGRRSLIIENVIRLIAALTAVGVFSWIGIMTYKHRREPLSPSSNFEDGGSSPRA